jgi:hypothetical protein
MMRITYLICETASILVCEERTHDFTPPIPVACIHAAGPELARITPRGWGIARWTCARPDPERGYALNDPED